MDDLAYARLKAINDRAPVYMVFAPANTLQAFPLATTIPERRRLTNVFGGAFSSYAIVRYTDDWDQPGPSDPPLLERVEVAPGRDDFCSLQADGWQAPEHCPTSIRARFLASISHFPSSKSARFYLPCIGFNPQGQLISGKDEIVTLAKGSVFLARNKNGTVAMQPPDVQLNPPVNAPCPRNPRPTPTNLCG